MGGGGGAVGEKRHGTEAMALRMTNGVRPRLQTFFIRGESKGSVRLSLFRLGARAKHSSHSRISLRPYYMTALPRRNPHPTHYGSVWTRSNPPDAPVRDNSLCPPEPDRPGSTIPSLQWMRLAYLKIPASGSGRGQSSRIVSKASGAFQTSRVATWDTRNTTTKGPAFSAKCAIVLCQPIHLLCRVSGPLNSMPAREFSWKPPGKLYDLDGRPDTPLSRDSAHQGSTVVSSLLWGLSIDTSVVHLTLIVRRGASAIVHRNSQFEPEMWQ